MYTTRNLTVLSDILNGLAGILAVLTEHSRSGFVSGLPVASLDLALLWTTAKPLSHRTLPKPQANSPSVTDPSFPSWSWAGWLGPAAYRLPSMDAKQPPKCEVDIFHVHHHGHFHTINGRRNAASLEYIEARKTKTLDHTTLEIEHVQTGVSRPDFGPNVLQFWAEAVDASFFNFNRDKNQSPDFLSKQDSAHSKSEKVVLRMRDKKDRHCGLWFESKVDRATRLPHFKNIFKGIGYAAGRELIALSRLGDAVEKRWGPFRVEGEIDLFDEEEFPSKGPESGLVNVLVVRWDRDITTRVTVAQVHELAWREARPRRKHIRLA